MNREDVRTRARELAAIAGRHPPYVAQIDYEQAKREVTGESELNRQEEMLDGGSPSNQGKRTTGFTGATG